MYFMPEPANLPVNLTNRGYSNQIALGAYAVNNIKYTGSGYFYDIIPTKSGGGYEHIYFPAQRTTLVGDALLYTENQDFEDKSAFEVELDVFYQKTNSLTGDYSVNSGEDSNGISDCRCKVFVGWSMEPS